MTELCGWLIKGDPERPCVWKPGHKGRHRDATWREARREYKREWYAQNREAQLEYFREWYAQNREAQLEYFREWYAQNREAKREYNREWYAQNREAQLEYNREYAKANPDKRRAGHHRRRARKAAVPHEDWTRQQLLELYGEHCYLCDKPLPEDWHAEHVIPISRGGWDVVANLRPACSPCNLRKGDRMPPAIVQARIWYDLGLHEGITQAA